MSLSDDSLSPTEKNRTSIMSQEPRESPHDSFSLRSKETEKRSHTSMSQETHVPPMNTDEEALNNQISMSQATQKPFVYPIHTDEEILKTRYDSYWENPNYFDSDNIIMNTANMLNPSGGMFEGSLDSAGTQMKPTSGQYQDQYGINTSGPFEYNKSDIAFGSFGSIVSMMNAKREREKNEMIPSPGFVNAPPQWPVKKKLTWYDVSSKTGTVFLHRSSVSEHIRRHMPEADRQKLITINGSTIVKVYDYDLGTVHDLRLTLRKQSYVLTDNWVEDFILRRSLREKDEIGLSWDTSASRLVFGVISRSKKRRYTTS